MKYAFLIFILVFIGLALNGQTVGECPDDPPFEVPQFEETADTNCLKCGDCDGSNFSLPEINDPNDLISIGANGGDDLFGLITHDEIREDMEGGFYPFSPEQAIGMGELIDGNVDMQDLMECMNMNCLSPFGGVPNVNLDFGQEILSVFGNLDELSQEQIDLINANASSDPNITIPSGYSSYFEWLSAADIFNSVSSDSMSSAILDELIKNFPECALPNGTIDFNCVMERQAGLDSHADVHGGCGITLDLNESDTAAAKALVKSSFNVEGNLDLFSTRVPGTAMEGGESLTPSPAGMDILSHVQDNVNLYNGSLSTQVPLHTIVANDLSIPISLRTRGTGIKVDDLGSEVGANWMLDAGGTITRMVNNLPDEYVNTDGREVGRGRGPGMVLKPCFDIDFGGVDILGKTKTIEWSPYRPNEVRFNHVYATTYVIVPAPIPVVVTLQFYFTIKFRLNVRLKPDYYTLKERGIGYMHLLNPDHTNELLPDGLTGSVNVEKFHLLPAEEQGRILAVANGKRRFEDQRFISSHLETFYQYFQGISNLFGEEEKVYTNLDLQADDFAYSFPGYQGKFIITQSGEVYTQPANDLEITRGNIVEEDGVHYLSGFDVETPEGVVYTFGSPDATKLSEMTGVELTKHTTYTLPNHLTYPRKLLSSKLKGAAIDQSAFPYAASLLCYPRALGYGSTYENLYTVQRSPRFSSTWKLTKVLSLITREEIELGYINQDSVRYNSNKSIKHSFPNFAIPNNNAHFQATPNQDLNPINLTEYTNLKGEFTYTTVETEYNEQRLSNIQTSRLEDAHFLYEASRKDLVDSRLLTKVQIHRKGNIYRTYQLRYEDYDKTNVFGCSPATYSEVATASEGFSFRFKPPHEKWQLGLRNYRMYSFYVRIGRFPNVETVPNPTDLDAMIEFFAQQIADLSSNGEPAKKIDIPLVFPTFRQERDNLSYLDEYGSILFVKGVEKKGEGLTSAEVEESEAIFNAEGGRSFLHGIDVIGHDGTSRPHVDFEYEGKLNQLPKRFSTQQDKWGYFVNNPSKSLLPPIKYEGADGNPYSIEENPNGYLQHHFDFLDLEADPSLDKYHEGQTQTGSLDLARIGALKTIIYPTGGTTRYSYELNDDVQDYQIIENAGAGLRVQLKIQSDGEGLTKVISYDYEDPTVVNQKQQIVQSPFAKSDYDYSDLSLNVLDIRCPETFGSIGPIFQRIDGGEDIDLTNCGSTGLETLVTTSTGARNEWMMNGSGYVGYGKVTELIGKEADFLGKIEHRFLTPIAVGVSYSSIYHINHIRRSVVDPGDWSNSSQTDGRIPPFGQIKTYENRFGLETNTDTYNANNELVQETINDYAFQGECIRQICKPVYSINSLTHDRRYPGSFLVSLIFDQLKNFAVPDSDPLMRTFLSIVTDGVLIDHPYRFLSRDYLYAARKVRPDYPRLISSVTTNHFPDDGSKNSMTTKIDYEFIPTQPLSSYRRTKQRTTYSNNQSTETRYFYLGDDESKWAISTATLTEDYLRSFGKTIGYGAPLRTEEYTNGTLTGGSMTTLKLLGASDSRQLVPTTQWSPLNGNWQRVSELREWNAATQPTVTYSTLYNEAGLTNTILGTFNRTEHEYNDFLQLEKTKVFDDDEVGNVFFERSYNYNDDFSELFNSVDENNITISFEYDGLGRLREKKSNNDRITENYEYSYQPAIVLTTTTFDDGTPSQSVERRFNGLGMPTSVTRQDGAQLSVITYDNNFRTLTEKALGRPLTTQTYEASPLSQRFSV